MHAFIDCQKHALLKADNFAGLSALELQELIDRMYQLRDSNLKVLIQEGLGCVEHTPKLLKDLIKRKAEDSRVTLVWDSIQSEVATRRIVAHGCSAPVAVLKDPVLKREMSVEDAERMLSTLGESHEGREDFLKEAHALYTALFWEAPETVLIYLLDQVSEDFAVEQKSIWNLLRLTKDSNGVWKRLIGQCGKLHYYWQTGIQEFRPDLVKELEHTERQ